MARKTIPIEDVKKRVNDFLKNTKDFMKPERDSMAMMLESILMDTGNYKGFGYLDKFMMKSSTEGTTFGIHDHGSVEEHERFKGTDNSRVYYF